MTDASTEWIIDPPRSESRDNLSRIVGAVAGHEVWFESRDTTLTPSIEALAAPMLIPALEQGVTVRLTEPVDATWLEGQKRLTDIYRSWWYPKASFPFLAETHPAKPTRANRLTATCFTGGVDSFYSLLRPPKRIDALFFVQGYDIGLNDDARMAGFETSLTAVADALGKRLLRLRSNLRDHPHFAMCHWGRTHGAALAAAAHLLVNDIHTLIIPSSYYHLMDIAWGTHWETDHHHSSSRLTFLHHGHKRYRFQKTRSVARHPLSLRHARVCWENRTASGNCGQCEKCLRTMVALDILGVLDQATAFDHQRPLLDRLEDLPTLPRKSLCRTWSLLLVQSAAPPLRNAIYRLLQRTNPGAPIDLPTLREDPRLHVRAAWNNLRAKAHRS